MKKIIKIIVCLLVLCACETKVENIEDVSSKEKLINAFPDFEEIIVDYLNDHVADEFYEIYSLNQNLSYSEICDKYSRTSPDISQNVKDSIEYLNNSSEFTLKDCVYGRIDDEETIYIAYDIYKNGTYTGMWVYYYLNIYDNSFDFAGVSIESLNSSNMDYGMFCLKLMTSFDNELESDLELLKKLYSNSTDGYSKHNGYVYTLGIYDDGEVDFQVHTEAWLKEMIDEAFKGAWD